MIIAANPVLQAAHDFWCSLPQPVNIPDIRLLDVATIPRVILPHLVIAEVTRANFDFGRLRLCGSEITRWFREMPEGMDVKQLAGLTDPLYIRHLRDLMAELIQRRKPIYNRSFYTLPGLTEDDPENLVTTERLVLPMADGGTPVECVVMVQTLHASDSRTAPIRFLPPEPGLAMRHDPFELVS